MATRPDGKPVARTGAKPRLSYRSMTPQTAMVNSKERLLQEIYLPAVVIQANSAEYKKVGTNWEVGMRAKLSTL